MVNQIRKLPVDFHIFTLFYEMGLRLKILLNDIKNFFNTFYHQNQRILKYLQTSNQQQIINNIINQKFKFNYKLNQMSEGQHHGHYKHPKIAKNTSSKLPDAFLQSKTTVIIPKKVQQQKIKQENSQKQKQNDPINQAYKQQNDKKKQNQKVSKKNKQSRNPFLPIRKFKEQMEKFAQQRKAVQQLLSQHRFEHLRIRDSSSSFGKVEDQQRMKYEDFITLTLVNKKQTNSLKKILHVPTLKVYYLRQSLINLSIDKSQLTEWMQNCNQQSKKIVQMFWNMPQGYYSLVYQYQDGILMETLLDLLYALPMDVIQNIAISHFTSNIGIYNSQLIMKVNQQNNTSQIYYMPIYEQTPPLIKSQKLQNIINQEIDQDDIDRKIIWRLGIILMTSFLGEQFFRSDILQLQLPLKSCCLFHSIIQLDTSLCKIFLDENNLFQQAQTFISFLCHLLSIKKSPTFTKSLSQMKNKKHKFLTSKFQSLVTLKQLFHTICMIDLQDCNYALGQFGSQHKLHRTIDVIGLSLQNINLSKFKKIQFSAQNKNILYIAQELGLKNNVQKVVKCLKQVYEKQGR